MNKAKKVLSFLLALVMLSSIFGVVASAKAPYLDGAILTSQYDDHDKPSFSTNQLASMVCDFLDDLLEEQDIYEDLSVLGQIDLRSIDTALRDIYSLIGTATGIGIGLVGDLKNLKRDMLKDVRRTNTPAATADLNVLNALFAFLGNKDNREIVGKLVKGNLNMGIIDNFFTLDLDVNQMLKELLFEEAYKDTPVPEPVNVTVDQMVEDLITALLVGTEEEPGFAPGLDGYINIATSTKPAYDFIEDLLQVAYNVILVPLLNEDLKEIIRELCGVVDGDESNLNEFAQILNINYVVPEHVFPAGSTLIGELNNIAYEIISAVTIGYTAWEPGGAEKILGNLTNAAKYIFALAGDGIFADYIPTKSVDEIYAMNSQQLFSYIVRSALNQEIEYMLIPEDADTLTKILWYAVKDLNDHNIPNVNYSAVPKTLEGALDMLGDYIAYELNKKIDMNPTKGGAPGEGLIAYGLGFDGTLLAITEYARVNYGGLLNLSLSSTDPWAVLDTVVFSIINSNWLPTSIGGSSKELIVNRLVRDALELNVENLFALLDRNPASELATKTVKKLLVDTVAKLFNLIFPGAFLTTYTSLEQVLTNNELGSIVERLLDQLNVRKAQLLPALLPLLGELMGIAVPQKFKAPSLGLPTQIGSGLTIQINNESEGVNTGHRDKNGAFSQDALYKIRIVSLTSDVPGLNITNLAGTTINGGERVNATLSGSFGADQVLALTMEYDVYTEEGGKLTDEPLTLMAYSYISSAKDDTDNWTEYDTEGHNNHTSYYKSFYFNQNAGAGSINATRVRFKRPETSTSDNADSTISRKKANLPAALSNAGITAAPFPNFGTNKDGGTWDKQILQADSDTFTTPAFGKYTADFEYHATTTKSGVINKREETWNHNNRTFFFFYDDHGLPGLFRSELGKLRNPADYDFFAWEDYVAAMKNAASVVYRPKLASNFQTHVMPSFEPAVDYLEEAIEYLESTQVGASVDALKTAMDAVVPDNGDLDGDDPAYKYFGAQDYHNYTYDNFRDEYKRAEKLWKSQQIDDEAEEPQEIPALNPADVAYALHRLELYSGRLVRTVPNKTKLADKIAMVGNPVKENYTQASWDAFERSYNFAVAVNAESASALDGNGDHVLRQSKIDSARYNLVNDYKKLIISADYSELLALIAQASALDAANYTDESWADLANALAEALGVSLNMSAHPANQAIIDAAAALLEEAIALLELAGEILEAIIGDDGAQSVVDLVNQYVYGLGALIPAEGNVEAGQGYTASFIANDLGMFGTGSTVELNKDGHEPVVFTVIVFGDLNGDGVIDGTDAGVVEDAENSLATLGEDWLSLAADADNNGNIDGNDASAMIDQENSLFEIDQISPRG